MKYFIFINQVGIFDSQLHTKTDLTDWIIIDYLHDWFFAEDKRTLLNPEDGKQYTLINYNHLIESLPLLGINTKKSLTLRFKKLKELNLIKTIQMKDNSLYFVLTSDCINIISFRKSLSGAPEVIAHNQTDNKPINNKAKRKRYGEYKHVLLSDEEYKRLQERFEGNAEEWIRKLDEGIELKGYKYKSHYLAILKWSEREKKQPQIRKCVFVGQQDKPCYMDCPGCHIAEKSKK